MAVASINPSDLRRNSEYNILIFGRIFENVSETMSHPKQQSRSVRALFSVQTTARQSPTGDKHDRHGGRRGAGVAARDDERREALETRTDAAQAVIDAWGTGDRAGAVRSLAGSIPAARTLIAKAKGG
jgi:hypothetical protein